MKAIKHGLMNILLEAFKTGSKIHEETILKHGSTIDDILSTFKDNQYVFAERVVERGRVYVTGRVLNRDRERYGLLPLNWQNYNCEEYMKNELPKQEGNC
jgi:hypothetical protein